MHQQCAGRTEHFATCNITQATFESVWCRLTYNRMIPCLFLTVRNTVYSFYAGTGSVLCISRYTRPRYQVSGLKKLDRCIPIPINMFVYDLSAHPSLFLPLLGLLQNLKKTYLLCTWVSVVLQSSISQNKPMLLPLKKHSRSQLIKLN